MIKKVLSLLFTASLCLGTAASVEAVTLARVVAVVNGDMITQQEVDKALGAALKSEGLSLTKAEDAAKVAELRKAVLESMIDEKIMLQAAHKLDINVPNEQVDAEMQRVQESSQLSAEAFERQLKAQGLSREELWLRLRTNLTNQALMRRMVVNKVVVTKEEVDQFYRERAGIVGGGQVRIALLIYPADVNAADWAKRIGNDKDDFLDAARQISVGPNPENGGDMGFMNLSDLAPALRVAVADLEEGDVSKLVDTEVSKAQVCLLERQEADEKTEENEGPDDETRARIEEILAQPRIQARLAEYRQELRSKALIEIRD